MAVANSGALAPLLAIWATRVGHYDEADFYAAGRSANAGHVMGAALGGTRTVTLRNYYLEGVIDGVLMFRVGSVICGGLLTAMVAYGMVVR